ncbi:CaiB/BaiF CoA transferase family protein [Galactobacter caseinivorans]|nr:CoA transferase [Galactobacter caseinivorans]
MLPLDGIRVIDLSRALAGPYATSLLADLGAEVIKLETPKGDPSRSWPPFHQGNSLYFDSVNRSKRSVVIDLYTDAGRAVLDALLATADLLVENFKFGTLAAMGYGPERLRELNPELIHVEINAYGQTGPWRELPGLDQVIQAVGGITSVTGAQGEPGVSGNPAKTYRVGLPIVDITSGLSAALGAVALLVGRERGGEARRVSTSLFETAAALSVFQGQSAIVTGEAAVPHGNDHPSITPYGLFPTATESMVLAASTQRHWEELCQAVGREELVRDARFATGEARTVHRAALLPLLSAALRERPAEHWIAELSGRGIPCGPVLDYVQLFATEQAKALGLVVGASSQTRGDVPVVRSQLSVDGTPLAVRSAPPLLGQDTDAVLAALAKREES